jgi:Fe-S-cluster containining protein
MTGVPDAKIVAPCAMARKVKKRRIFAKGRSYMLFVMHYPAGDSELVQIMDAALDEAARRAGEWLVCRAGCTQCCFGAFAINSLDALRLGAGMEALRTEDPALATEVERRARGWIAEFGAEFPGDAVTGRLGDSDAERERFEEFANEAACPALDPATGRCAIYAWRPMTCRVFGPPVRMDSKITESDALGHCELCFAGASEAEVAACEMTLPHEMEAGLLDEMDAKGETVVAFALLRQG